MAGRFETATLASNDPSFAVNARSPKAGLPGVVGRTSQLIVMIAAGVVLAGCGGGGGGGGPPTTTTTVPAPTTTTTTTKFPLYTCDAHYTIPTHTTLHKKGMCIDDTTFSDCPDKMLGLWPNTQKPYSEGFDEVRVTSMRMFAPWKAKWGGDKVRLAAWENLHTWVKANNAKVLIGTEVTCEKDVDDEMWQWNLDLVKLLGKEHILGFAIGNEMDIYWQKYTTKGWSPQCVTELWDGGRYWQTLQDRVASLDEAGFSDSPITIVWAMSVLEGINLQANPPKPWKDKPGEAMIGTLMTQAFNKWPTRWVWSFNIYSIWDQNLWPWTAQECPAKSDAAVGIDYTKNMIRAVRKSMKVTTKVDNAPIWVGENGWSSPLPDGCGPFPACPQFGSIDNLRKAYEAFLNWDLSIDEETAGVDHAFYFTMRDSFNVQAKEGFGLIKGCEGKICKIESGRPPAPAPPPTPGKKSMCADLKCGNHDTTCWCQDSCIKRNSCCPDYKQVCGHSDMNFTTITAIV